MQDIRVQYDALAWATYVNIDIKTSGTDKIVFHNFDGNNKEHLYVMAVVMSCWNVLGEKAVYIDDNVFVRARLSRRYKNICKVGKATGEEENYIDINELLDFMRDTACQMCGPEFTFGDIYDKYYAEERIFDEV